MGHIPKVVCINGNGIGQCCNVVRIPKKGETAIPTNLHYCKDSGKGVNCAIVIGRLGGDVSYVGKAGKDDGGELNEQWLQESGVHLEHFWLQDGIKTSLGLILVAENGENLIFNFDSPESDITVEEAVSHVKELKGAEYMITGFEIPHSVAYESARVGCELGMKVFINPSPFDDASEVVEMPFVDTMAVNEIEALMLLGTTKEETNDWMDAAKRLCEKYKVKNVLITLGGDGAVHYGERGLGHVSGIKVKVVDESGAGDAFLAVFVQCLIWGMSVQKALEYSNKYCAWLVQKPGEDGVIGKYLYLNEMKEVLDFFESKEEK